MEKKKFFWTLMQLGMLLMVSLFGYPLWKRCTLAFCDITNQYTRTISQSLIGFLPKFFFLLVLFIVFKLMSRLFRKIISSNFFAGFQPHDALAGITRLSSFLWWLIFFIIGATVIVGNVGALATSLGLVGFGLTLALQKPILNFVGWFTISMKGMYKEGDRIELGNIRGDVKEIQIMNTILDGLLPNSQVKSHKTVSFPNEMVLTTEMKNFTKDSNYVMDELNIGVTYESDYHKAIQLLSSIIVDHIQKNRKLYTKRAARTSAQIKSMLDRLTKNRTKDSEDLEKQAKQLQEDQRKLTRDKQLLDLEEEFKPKIRVEMLDSAIQLTAQFLTPYNLIKKNRTTINLAFLDAIKKEKNIQVAYPHMEIVYDGVYKKKKEESG